MYNNIYCVSESWTMNHGGFYVVENHFELRCVKLVNDELTSKLVAMEQKLNGILASQITTKDRILKPKPLRTES